MRSFILVACLAAAGAQMVANSFVGADGGAWYGTASSDWSAGHFPRTSENCKVDGKTVVFDQTAEPAYMAGSTQGDELEIVDDGVVEINGDSSVFELGDAANAPQNCQIGGWSAFDQCTADCNGGRQTRSRTLTQPLYGGDVCPDAESEQDCNTQACPTVCSHTTCRFGFERGAWRTTVMHEKCAETNGDDFHCEHHHGTKTVSLLGGGSATHTDECVCYCDYEGTSSITHTHWDSSNTGRAGAGVRATHTVGSQHLLSCDRI